MTHNLLSTDLTDIQLQEDFFALLEERPLDDVIDALSEAFRRRAGDILNVEDGEAYRNVAQELTDLKSRDFATLDEFDAAPGAIQ